MTLVLLSIPDFLLGTLLLLTFVLLIPVLPAMSTVDQTSAFWNISAPRRLPALTLAIVMAVYAVRMLRDNLIEVLDADYIRMAELRGVPSRAVSSGATRCPMRWCPHLMSRPQSGLSGWRRRGGGEGLQLSGLRQPSGRQPAIA